MPINMQNLRTLASRQTQPKLDPFVTRRSAEIHSGLADMAPEDDDLDMHLAQQEIAGRTGWAPSRDAIRGSVVSKLRSALGQGAIKHQQDLELEERKGAFEIEKERIGAAALGDRLRFGQDQIGQRQEQNQAAIMARLEKTLGAQGGRQEDAQAFTAEQNAQRQAAAAARPQAIPQTYNKAIEDAEANMPGNPFTRYFRGESANRQLETALTGYLDRAGELQDAQAVASQLSRYQGSLDDRIAQAQNDPDFEYDLSQLHPYTRKYLGLKLGQ